MADQCTQHLMREHRAAEEVIAVLDSLQEGTQQHALWSEAQREPYLRIRRLLTVEFPLHVRKEEEVLFPALEGALPVHEGPLNVLRSEHRSLRTLAEKICEVGDLLAGGSPPAHAAQEFVALARSCCRLLRDHLYKEDRVMYPMVARLLSPERDAEILQEMLALEKPAPIR